MNRTPVRSKLQAFLAGRTLSRVTTVALLLIALCTFLGVKLLLAAPGTEPRAAVSEPGSKLTAYSKDDGTPSNKTSTSAGRQASSSFAPLIRSGAGGRLAPTVQQILCVGGGTVGTPCTNATPFASIQSAITAAAGGGGDEIRVAGGVYTASAGSAVVTISKPFTLTGGYPGGVSGWTTPGDETQTVIDGQNAREGIKVSVGALTSVAQNLSVVNGGILISINSTLNNDMPVRTRNLSLDVGTIGGSAPITVTNIFTWTGGTQADAGHTDLLAGGQLSILGAVTASAGRTVNNFGAATLSGAGNITLSGGGTFNNQTGATFTIQNNTSISEGAFNNLGTMIKTSNGDTNFTFNAPFSNSGLVQIQAGRL